MSCFSFLWCPVRWNRTQRTYRPQLSPALSKHVNLTLVAYLLLCAMGSHLPLGDRQACLPGEERANIRPSEIPVKRRLLSVSFSFLTLCGANSRAFHQDTQQVSCLSLLRFSFPRRFLIFYFHCDIIKKMRKERNNEGLAYCKRLC